MTARQRKPRRRPKWFGGTRINGVIRSKYRIRVGLVSAEVWPYQLGFQWQTLDAQRHVGATGTAPTLAVAKHAALFDLLHRHLARRRGWHIGQQSEGDLRRLLALHVLAGIDSAALR